MEIATTTTIETSTDTIMEITARITSGILEEIMAIIMSTRITITVDGTWIKPPEISMEGLLRKYLSGKMNTIILHGMEQEIPTTEENKVKFVKTEIFRRDKKQTEMKNAATEMQTRINQQEENQNGSQQQKN